MLSGKYKVTKETHKHPYEFLQHSEVNNIKHRYIYSKIKEKSKGLINREFNGMVITEGGWMQSDRGKQ